MTIYERLDNAYKDVAKVTFKKDKWVGKWVVTRDKNGKQVKNPDPSDTNGYWVISITQILDAVQKVHAEHGIKCIFEGPFYDQQNNEKRITISHKDKYGNDVQTVVANGHYDVKIIGEGPDDMIETRAQCEGKDSSNNDKLGNKLLTNGMRSLYRSMYSIDGDDTRDPEEENIAVQGAPAEEAPKTDGFLGGGMTMNDKKKAVLAWIPENQQDPDFIEFCKNQASGADTTKWGLGTFVHFYDDVVAQRVAKG